MDDVLDVFGDASWNRRTNRYSGAWIVGRRGTPNQISLMTDSSLKAEMLVLIAGIEGAMKKFRIGQQIVVHSDLRDIRQILFRANRGVAAHLEWRLKQCGGVIFGDAQIYPEYKTCHIHARAKAGCYGLDCNLVQGSVTGSKRLLSRN